MTKHLKVFQPRPAKFRITPNVVVYILVAVTCSILALKELLGVSIPFNAPLLGFSIAITAVAILFYSISSLSKYEPLNGAFIGRMLLKEDEIEINGKSIHLHEVKQLDFYLGDFYGRVPLGSNQGNFNPVRSQGVANFIEITYAGQQKQKNYFRLENKQEYKSLFPLIEEWMRKGKISFLRGIELLEIVDYEEIQVFKKEITSTSAEQTLASA